MRSICRTYIFLLCLASPAFAAGENQDVASKSRDASLAFIGTINFLIGRIGSECLTVVGRSESPKQFVGVWQQRNIKYLKAADIYMRKRLEEAQASGGSEKRETVLREAMGAVRSSGESTIQGWFNKDGKEAACKRVVGLIDAGGFDISPKMRMYSELKSLVSWATQKSQTSP